MAHTNRFRQGQLRQGESEQNIHHYASSTQQKTK